MTRALILAPLLLAGCATIPQVCDLSLRAASTAQEAISILERDWHLDPVKAASWASIILKGSAGVALFCAAVAPSPVATPGS